MQQVANPKHIVAIGASAGGLDAVKELISKMPKKTDDTALIVCHHHSSKHKSQLAKILAPLREAAIVEAIDNMPLEGGKVYIIPANSDATVHQGVIQLTKPDNQVCPKPSIDNLFASFIGMTTSFRISVVILSGSGSDGSKHLKELSQVGAAILVQSPNTCEYPSMPNAAIDTGAVDAQLSPQTLGKEIKLLYKYSTKKSPKENTNSPQIQRIYEIIKSVAGINFAQYKTSTFLRRLEHRIALLNISSIDAYADFIEQRMNEVDHLIEDVLIPVTEFFRDDRAFQDLSNTLQNKMQKHPSQLLRIWVAGCSTGEEAYTLLLIFLKLEQELKKPLAFQIFATDLNEKNLQFARKGVFPKSQLGQIPVEYHEFLTLHDSSFSFSKEQRERILFTRHDMLANPPFLKVDLISCRNVMIYFNNFAKSRLIPTFHYALNSDGILFLGKSESVLPEGELFNELHHTSKVYSKIAVEIPAFFKYGNITTLPTYGMKNALKETKTTKERSYSELVKDVIFIENEKPRVVINDKSEILEIFGDSSSYLGIFSGGMNKNIQSLIHPELRLELKALLHACLHDQESRKSARIVLHQLSESFEVEMSCRFLQTYTNQQVYLITFHKTNVRKIKEDIVSTNADLLKEHIQELENELRLNREQLQNFIEELETTNEELLSLNEELQSTNEELNASNEELESTNEELLSSNEEVRAAYSELKTKNNELEQKETALRINESNLKALINNTLKASILVDDHYKVITYNTTATQLIQTLSSETIRNGVDITRLIPSADYAFFKEELADCFSGKLIQKEYSVAISKKKTLIFKINMTPITDVKGKISVASIAFLDITVQKKAEDIIVTNARKYESLVNNSFFGFIESNKEGLILNFNETVCSTFGHSKSGLHRMFVRDLFEIEESEYLAKLKTLCDKGIFQKELTGLRRNGQQFPVLVSASVYYDQTAKEERYSYLIEDLSEQKRDEAFTLETNRIARIGGWEYDVTTNELIWSDITKELHEVDQNYEPIVSEAINFYKQGTSREAIQKAFEEVLTNGTPFDLELTLVSAKGRELIVRAMGKALYHKNKIAKVHGTFQDITQRTLARKENEKEKERFKTLIENTVDIIFEMTLDGKLLYVSPNWERQSGYSPEEALNKDFLSYVHPDDLSLCYAYIERVIQDTQANDSIEYRVLHKSGEYLWHSAKGRKLKSDSGTTLLGSAREIHKQKLAEIALQNEQSRLLKEKEKFENFALSVPGVIFEFEVQPDGTSKFNYLSEKITDIFHINPKGREHIDELLMHILPKHHESFKQSIVDAVINFTDWNYEGQIICGNGSIKWFEGRAIPRLNDQNNIVFNGLLIDANERKNMEANFRETTMIAKVGGWEFNPISHEIRLNPVTYKLLHLESDQSIDIAAITKLLPSNLEMHPITTLFQDCLREGTPWEYDMQLTLSNGDIKWFKTTGEAEFRNDICYRIHGILQDIDEEKKADFALKQNEEYLRAIFDNSLTAILVADDQGKYYNINRAAADMFGFDIHSDTTWTIKHIHVPDMEDTRKRYNEFLRIGQSSGEFEFFDNLGKKRTAFYQSVRIRENFNVSMLIDVTDQLAIQSELRKTSLIARETINGAIICDVEGRITWVNKAFERITGYKLEEVVGKRPGSILQGPNSDKETIAYMSRQLKKQKGFKAEIVNYRKSGQEYWVSVQCQPLLNEKGEFEGYFAMETDISKDKTEERQLRLLDTVIKNANDIVVIMEAKPVAYPGPKVVYVNDAFERITGYSKSDVVGRAINILHGFETDDDSKTMVQTALENQQPIAVEQINYRKTGERFWMSMHISPVLDDKGNLSHWISIQRDITKEKEAEFEREQLIQELSDTNADLKQFTYITSHNLRAPITNLLTISELLDDEEARGTANKELIDGLKKSTTHLNDTLNDLIKILLIKESKNIELQRVVFCDIFEKVKSSLRVLLESSKAKIIIDFEQVPDVLYSPSYMESILLNLITNSIKYSAPDRSPVILISTKKINNHTQMLFSDNGIGMDMNQVKGRIFGLYQRFHNHPESKGIGLYLVHSQVTALGGTIQVNSTLNEGTTFQITFKN
jgi:PAS domain S-box-containing protein